MQDGLVVVTGGGEHLLGLLDSGLQCIVVGPRHPLLIDGNVRAVLAHNHRSQQLLGRGNGLFQARQLADLGKVIDLGKCLDRGVVHGDVAPLLLVLVLDRGHDVGPVGPLDVCGQRPVLAVGSRRRAAQALTLVDLGLKVHVLAKLLGRLDTRLDRVVDPVFLHVLRKVDRKSLLGGHAPLLKLLFALVGLVVLLEGVRIEILVELLERRVMLLGVLLELLVAQLVDHVDGDALVVETIGRLLRGHHGVALALAHGDPFVLVQRGAVIAAEFILVGTRVDKRAVLGVARLGIGRIEQVDAVGDGGAGLVGGAGERAHVHVGLRRKDVSGIERSLGPHHDRVVRSKIVVLVGHVLGVIAVGVDVEVVGLAHAQRRVVVRDPEVAGVVAVLVLDAPRAGEVLGVKGVAGLGAPAVLDEPCAVARRGVRSGVLEARGEVLLAVGVVPAHDGHGVIQLGVVVGVVGPLGADVLGLVVLVARPGVVGGKADGHSAAVVLIARAVAVVQLVFDDVHGVPVHAHKLAVRIEVARIGHLVTVLEIEKRAVPPGEIVLIKRLVVLRGDRPVGVDLRAVRRVVVAGIALLLVADDGLVLVQGVDLRLGEVLDGLLARRGRGIGCLAGGGTV